MNRCLLLLLSLLSLLSACEGARPVHFRVVNQGAERIYLPGPEGFWQLSRGGRRLSTGDACACICSERKCYACGITPGMVLPLEPGGAHEWSWDGRIWREAGKINGQPCQRPEALTPGAVTVTVFHGTRIRQGGTGDTYLDTPPAVTSVDFNHPEDQVEIVIR